MRSARAWAPNPANTTEWMAPMRAHASIRYTASGHVGMERVTPVALPHPEGAQGRRRPGHVELELRVGADHPLAALVQVDEGGASALAGRHVVVDGVVGEIGLRADEPAERRRVGGVHLVPGAEPRQPPRRAFPEALGVPVSLVNPALNDRGDDLHGVVSPVGSSWVERWNPASHRARRAPADCRERPRAEKRAGKEARARGLRSARAKGRAPAG